MKAGRSTPCPPEQPMDILKSNLIEYFDGNRKREITNAHLKDIRTRVTTHEGETLHGSAGKHYMDKYSKKYLGKDLNGSYQKNNITDK